MIQSYLFNGEFKERKFDSFEKIVASIENNRKKLYEFKLDTIISLFDKVVKVAIKNPELMKIPGMTYVCLWLKKKNLENICKINHFDLVYADEFKESLNNLQICAQPRGIVVQWIAGNIPTLSIFSIIMSILAKNGTIVKIPESNKEAVIGFFKKLKDVKIEEGNKKCSGYDILKTLSLVAFSSEDQELSKEFSLVADCKVIWGGSEAVKAIIKLPQREHCEIIVFGPKYSFGVYDKECIESDIFDKYLEKSVNDIIIFDQMACTSPHVLFFEKSKYSLREIAERIKEKFEKLVKRYSIQDVSQDIAARIINVRGEYLLDEKKDMLMSKDLSWTILINDNISLEEPIQGRCIFIKEVKNIEETLPHITRKVQTLSLGILDEEKIKDFSKKATYNGIDRCVIPGRMHDFDSPWDGMLPINRLVRWVLIKK